MLIECRRNSVDGSALRFSEQPAIRTSLDLRVVFIRANQFGSGVFLSRGRALDRTDGRRPGGAEFLPRLIAGDPSHRRRWATGAGLPRRYHVRTVDNGCR